MITIDKYRIRLTKNAEEFDDIITDILIDIEELIKSDKDKQFKIDSLMLEYCPDEMTQSQRNNWALHQKANNTNLFIGIENGNSKNK